MLAAAIRTNRSVGVASSTRSNIPYRGWRCKQAEYWERCEFPFVVLHALRLATILRGNASN